MLVADCPVSILQAFLPFLRLLITCAPSYHLCSFFFFNSCCRC